MAESTPAPASVSAQCDTWTEDTKIYSTDRITQEEEDVSVDISNPSDLDASTSEAEDFTADPDSSEETWLKALEAGRLDEYGNLPKNFDTTLMTARQRSMIDGKVNRGSAEDKSADQYEILTEEMIVKRALKNKKRKQLAVKKEEEDKKLTIDRLLNSKPTTIAGKKSKGRPPKAAKQQTLKTKPKSKRMYYTYVNNEAGGFITFPEDSEFEIPYRPPVIPPDPQLCGVVGCGRVKRYQCSRTSVPLCSLGCYKVNLQLAGLT